MSQNALTFDGLADLQHALEQLPNDMTGEAAHIVEAAANSAAATIKAEYPVRTGELRDRLTVDFSRDGLSVVGTVRNTSKLAWIFENGTQARHTEIGANRGAMPPGHVFIPTVAARRRQMYAELLELVKRNGFEVSGDV